MTVYGGIRQETDGWLAVSLVIYDDGTSQTWTRRGLESKEQARGVVEAILRDLHRHIGGHIVMRKFEEFVN